MLASTREKHHALLLGYAWQYLGNIGPAGARILMCLHVVIIW